MRVRSASFVLLVFLVAIPGFAGQDDENHDDLIEQVREYDARKETRPLGLLGLRLSYPETVAGSVGVLWARHPVDFDCAHGCDHRGPMLEFAPGIDGAQIGAGYGILVGDKGRNKFFIRRTHIGWGVMAKYLRTWGNSPLNPEDQAFVGLEGRFTITQVAARLGFFRGTSRFEGSDTWLVTGGIGWGF